MAQLEVNGTMIMDKG